MTFSVKNQEQPSVLPTGIKWGLAPMEGVTDLAVRLWFALTASPQFAMTPFLRVTDTFPAKIPTVYAPELTVLRGLVPYTLIPQLMASRPEDFSRTAAMLFESSSFIDLNCGCPSPTVVGNGSGSSLLASADIFHDFVGQVAAACGAERVSVKMRTGFHDASEFTNLLAAVAEFSACATHRSRQN